MRPRCFTCNDQTVYDDTYLIETRNGPDCVIPVCDSCRIRHMDHGRIGTDYLFEDRRAHGLPATGTAYRL